MSPEVAFQTLSIRGCPFQLDWDVDYPNRQGEILNLEAGRTLACSVIDLHIRGSSLRLMLGLPKKTLQRKARSLCEYGWGHLLAMPFTLVFASRCLASNAAYGRPSPRIGDGWGERLPQRPLGPVA